MNANGQSDIGTAKEAKGEGRGCARSPGRRRSHDGRRLFRLLRTAGGRKPRLASHMVSSVGRRRGE